MRKQYVLTRRGGPELGAKWEKWVTNFLQVRGHQAVRIASKAHQAVLRYDILLENSIRIEVKSSRRNAKEHYCFNHFWRWPSIREGKAPFDFLILVAEETSDKYAVFVIPQADLGYRRSLTFIWPHSILNKYDLTNYLDAWHLIDAGVQEKE